MKACPRCGALNPEDHKFCGQCGQRINTPSTPEAQASTPAWLADMGVEDDAPEATGDAPPWLAQLQSTQPEASAAEPAPRPSADESLPDWLLEIEADAAAEPAAQLTPAEAQPDDLPAWLTTDDQPAAALPADSPADSPAPPPSLDELPPWLQELSAAPPQSTVPPSSTTHAEALPSWLQGDTTPADQDRPESPVADPAATAALPAWLGEAGDVDHHDSQPATRSTDQPDDLPAWLRADTDDQPPAVQPVESPPQPESGIPEWLLESDESTPAAGESSLDLPVPDWSSELGEPPAGDATADALPAWLRDSEDEPVSSVESPKSAGETEALPAWLLEESPTAPPAPEQTAAPAADSATQEIPAWLLEEASVSAEQPAAAASAEEELPAWLRDESPEATPAASYESSETLAAPAEVAATQELPAWLLGESSAESPATAPTESSATPPDDLPAWLRDESSDQGAAAAEPAPVANAAPHESSALPGWLAEDAAPVAEADSGITSDTTTPPDESLPAWLAGDDESSSGVTAAPAAPVAGDLPPWLAEAAESDEAGPIEPAGESSAQDVAQPLAAETAARTEQPTGDLPSWLATADEPALDAARATAQREDLPPWLAGIEDEPAQTASDSGLPAWLDAPESATATPAASQDDNLLGELDLPAWLREEAATPAPAPAAEPAPTWLQGIAAEAEEPRAATAAVAASAVKPRVERTPERLESVRLLERLRDEPAPEPVVERRARPRSWVGPVLLILAVLAILAVISVVLWGPGLNLNFGATPAAPVAAQNVAATIAALPAGRPVVVAYEWDARRLGDLRPLEDAVLGAIEARRDVPLVLISTDPQGALLAEQRASRLLGSGDPYRSSYGLGFAHLGFKAGGPVALRRFAGDAAFVDLFARDAYGNNLLQNDVVMQAMCGDGGAPACAWSNVGLLIIMADDLDDVRGWFEQVRSEHPALPVLLLTTEEVAPQALPYAALPETQMASGLRDAAALAQATGAPDDRVARRADAVAAGGALWGLLALVGAGPAYFAGRRARRDAEDDSWR